MSNTSRIWCITEGDDAIPFNVTPPSTIVYICSLKIVIATALQRADGIRFVLWKVRHF